MGHFLSGAGICTVGGVTGVLCVAWRRQGLQQLRFSQQDYCDGLLLSTSSCAWQKPLPFLERMDSSGFACRAVTQGETAQHQPRLEQEGYKKCAIAGAKGQVGHRVTVCHRVSRPAVSTESASQLGVINGSYSQCLLKVPVIALRCTRQASW